MHSVAGLVPGDEMPMTTQGMFAIVLTVCVMDTLSPIFRRSMVCVCVRARARVCVCACLPACKRARVLSFDARTGRYAVALDDGKDLSLKAEYVTKTGCTAAGCSSEEASSVCARCQALRDCGGIPTIRIRMTAQWPRLANAQFEVPAAGIPALLV